jgi:hypothetical protein
MEMRTTSASAQSPVCSLIASKLRERIYAPHGPTGNGGSRPAPRSRTSCSARSTAPSLPEWLCLQLVWHQGRPAGAGRVHRPGTAGQPRVAGLQQVATRGLRGGSLRGGSWRSEADSADPISMADSPAWEDPPRAASTARIIPPSLPTTSRSNRVPAQQIAEVRWMLEEQPRVSCFAQQLGAPTGLPSAFTGSWCMRCRGSG